MRIPAAKAFHLPIFFVAAFVLVSAPASAHHFMDNALPQTFAQGLLSGLGHPLIGADHAAFIVAAGFLLALVPHGLWGILALAIGSLAGAALHLQDYNLPAAETGVALSVLLVGALVMARHRAALPWLAAGLGISGVLHGYAYAETIFGAETTPLFAYLLGFSLIQFGVATAAYWIHRHVIAARGHWARPLSAGLGAAVGATGVVFLTLNIAN